jgi:hypothetical protein
MRLAVAGEQFVECAVARPTGSGADQSPPHAAQLHLGCGHRASVGAGHDSQQADL